MLVKLMSSPVASTVVPLLGAAASLALGTWLPLMTALLIMQIADIVTGVLVGGKEQGVTSSKFFKGIKKKFGMWILLIVANVIDVHFLGGLPILKSAVCTFLVAGEGMSLIENLGLLGVPIPEFVSQYLKKLQDDSKSSVDVNDLGTKINKGDD